MLHPIVWYHTLRYALFEVERVENVSKEDSLYPLVNGDTPKDRFFSIDLFRIPLSTEELNQVAVNRNTTVSAFFKSPISLLQHHHYAFLTCPLFQAELGILRTFGPRNFSLPSDAKTLQSIAKGSKGTVKGFAGWRNYLGPEVYNKQSEAHVVMRVPYPEGLGVFVDTWWSVKLLKEDTGGASSSTDMAAYLQFGSLLHDLPAELNKNPWTKWALTTSTPLHVFYSRFLVGSTKAQLLYGEEKLW